MKRLELFLIICWLILSPAVFAQSSQNKTKEVTGKMSKDWVPQWAKEVVWYQIFPERFRNGDKNNDPSVGSQKGAWPHDHTSSWEVHPWTSDWYELQPYEKKNGKDIWFNIQRRRYGGDLQGIIDKLDYLKKLGIGAIYLNPVFFAPSSHKYDAVCYQHIDPDFGPDPQGDRLMISKEKPDDPSTWKWTKADLLALKLIKEVHKRKMKIIFDGVFNHMGINNPFFNDVVKNQRKSPYKDWISIRSWEDKEKGVKFEYNGWAGVKELPSWHQNDNGIVEGPKKYIFDITRRWMKPELDGKPADGIDGWRLDVAFCVAHPFWKDWRKLVKSLNNEAYITAEVVDTVEANKPYLKGDEFDAVMNYNYCFAVSEYFINKQKRISTTEFDRRLKELRDAYDPCVAYVMQNLVDSHDTTRVASFIVNRDIGIFRKWEKFFDLSRGNNPAYDTRKPNEGEKRIQKLIAIFQMTYPGAPMVYYGDEAGMWGANDPCCRKPMLWEDMEYSDEVYKPDGTKKMNPDKVAFDRDMYIHYKKLIALRNRYQALKTGDFKTLVKDDESQIFAFSRECENEYMIIILNNSASSEAFSIKPEKKGSYADVLNGNAKFKTDVNGELKMEIKPEWGRILFYIPNSCASISSMLI